MTVSRKSVIVGSVLAIIVTVLLSGCSSGEYTECGRGDDGTYIGKDEGTYIGKFDTNLDCRISCLLKNKGYTEFFWCDKDKKCFCD